MSPDALARHRRTPPPPPPQGPRPGRPLVLVVEDDDASAKALQDVLLNANCDVELVGSAEAALGALRGRFFSLAIVDIALPGMDGRALLDRMAEDPNWRRIPAIVVSGHVAALPGHAIAFLRKPVQTAELLALVGRYSRR